jgi:hypothetical protein
MRFSVFLLTASLGLGCAKHAGSYSQQASTGTADQSAALVAEADAAWENRSDAAQLKAALVKYEAALDADSTNRHAAIRLTRGWYWYGDVHVKEDEAKLAAWNTAVQMGGRCMAVNSEFTQLLEKGGETEASAAAKAMTLDDAGCLYWTASALGKWAKMTGFTTLLKHKDTVKSYIETVQKLDDDFSYHAPDRYFGAYYAIAPSFAGGDLNKSKTHFDKSIAGSEGYLATKVLYAQYYATKQQDRDLFERLLNEVITADPTADPAIAPENKAEQAKAQHLLDTESDYFAE